MRTRAICVLAIVLAVAACGGEKKHCVYKGIRCENLPKPKLFRVNWSEKASLESDPIATFRVRTIEIRPRGWTITGSLTNTSPRTFTFPRGGPQSPKSFGLGVFVNALPQRVETPGNYLLKAKTVKPPFPQTLAPGETWSGTMTSDEPPRNRRWLRVLFGVFFWKGKPPYGLGPFFVWQTTHEVQAPGPVGPSS